MLRYNDLIADSGAPTDRPRYCELHFLLDLDLQPFFSSFIFFLLRICSPVLASTNLIPCASKNSIKACPSGSESLVMPATHLAL